MDWRSEWLLTWSLYVWLLVLFVGYMDITWYWRYRKLPVSPLSAAVYSLGIITVGGYVAGVASFGIDRLGLSGAPYYSAHIVGFALCMIPAGLLAKKVSRIMIGARP